MTETQKNNQETRITCKNCENVFSGNYCNQCGQKANIQRINLKHLLHNFFHAFTHMDRGYIHTLKELAIRPGHTIREYLQGKRSGHSDPLLMLLIIGGLCSVLYNHYHLKTLSSVDLSTFKGDMQMLSLKFYVLAFLGYSLILSLFDFLFFRYKGYNYFELLVMNIFACIEILFLTILLVPLFILLSSTIIIVYVQLATSFLIMVYLIFVRYQFFEAAGDRRAIRTLVADAIAVVLFVIITGWKTWQTMLA